MYNVEAHFSFFGLWLKLKKINGLQSNYKYEHYQRAEFQQDFHHQKTEEEKVQK